MRKIIITLVVLTCAYGANAQQLPSFLKTDSLALNNFLLKKPDSLGTKPVFKLNVTGKVNIDNMPIARMAGNSNMPIMQTDQTAYNMPVMGMRQPQVYIMKKPDANREVVPANNYIIK